MTNCPWGITYCVAKGRLGGVWTRKAADSGGMFACGMRRGDRKKGRQSFYKKEKKKESLGRQKTGSKHVVEAKGKLACEERKQRVEHIQGEM